MLAQFSIWALDDPHLRSEMETVREVLEDLGVKYSMGSMATTIEGNREVLLSAIAACHDRLTEKHSRLLINITIDDDRAGSDTHGR